MDTRAQQHAHKRAPLVVEAILVRLHEAGLLKLLDKQTKAEVAEERDLASILTDLCEREIEEAHVRGGCEVARAFVAALPEDASAALRDLDYGR